MELSKVCSKEAGDRPLVQICGTPGHMGFSMRTIVVLWRLMNRKKPRSYDPAVRRSGLTDDMKIVSRVGRQGIREDLLNPGSLPDGSEVRSIKVYTPSVGPARSTLLYFHGGGYVVGSHESADGLCRLLCRELGMAVYSLDYRLAPEHPYPAALEDAVAAYRFARETAMNRSGSFLVGGDSAGGHLATTLCLRLARLGLPAPDGQVLLYPVTDFSSFSSDSYREFAKGYILEKADMEWFRSCYVPDRTSWLDPSVSPLKTAVAAGQPPALILSAGFDVLRDEAEAWAQKLSAAGVPVLAWRMAGAIHGFATMTSIGPHAKQTVRLIGQFLSELPAMNRVAQKEG